MADQIDALMGLVPPQQSDQQALSRNLRKSRDLGQLFGFSGNKRVQAIGDQMSTDALSAASTAGTRNNQALARTRQAEQDRLAVEETAYDREQDANKLAITAGAYTDVKEMKDADGNIAWYGYKGGTGALVKVPDSEGLKEADSYRSGTAKRVTIDGTNISYLRYPDGKIVYGQKEYPDMEAFRKDRPDIITDAAVSQGKLARAKTYWSERGKSAGERTDSAWESVNTTRTLASDYGTLIDAIKSGAWTGKWAELFPTFDSATAYFESARDKMALTNLKRWKLTPVSDKDIRYLVSATVPALPPEQMLQWAQHKMEATERMAKAEAKMATYYEYHEGREPMGDDRLKLEAEIEEILHGGDFKFVDPFKQGSGDQVEAIPENSYGLTAEEWQGLTPEQQAQLKG